jgi:hypothetical protein
MKPLKWALRIWIAITSVLAFLGGWALFSHAAKPAPLFSSQPSVSGSEVTPLPTLQPIPSLDSLVTSSSTSNNSSLQPLPSGPSFNVQQQFFPRMRTMGS